MCGEAIKRLCLATGFLLATVSLATNLVLGRELLYSTYAAFCIMLAAPVVLLVTARGIAVVLFNYLQKESQSEDTTREKTTPGTNR